MFACNETIGFLVPFHCQSIGTMRGYHFKGISYLIILTIYIIPLRFRRMLTTKNQIFKSEHHILLVPVSAAVTTKLPTLRDKIDINNAYHALTLSLSLSLFSLFAFGCVMLMRYSSVKKANNICMAGTVMEHSFVCILCCLPTEFTAVYKQVGIVALQWLTRHN